MKKWMLILGSVAAVAVAAISARDENAGAIVAQRADGPPNGGQPGPALVGQMARFRLIDRIVDPADMVWRTLEGGRFSLGDYAGKVVLVNFWATWCGPCLQELPGINNVAAQLASDRFAAVAINIDANPEVTATRWMDRLELDALPLFVDPEYRSANVLGIRAMPSTFLFDAGGQMIGMLEGGAEWDSPEAIDMLFHYIDGGQTEL
ncbi:MAG: TlpA disulfide reductase family protein [Bauldia sp.]